ncbi:MAG: type IV toxin-antitoxin system AbiEi family antitoxin domain-containing protein [Solirubrobacteraceae bacterium]
MLDVDPNSCRESQAPVDTRLARLASRQHGIVTARQLRALGVSTRARDHRVQIGRLHPIHRGVYAVGHRDLSENGLFVAAVAAVGAEAALSHVSAAALWGLMRPHGDDGVDVTVTRSIKPRPGIRLHVTRSLPPFDVTRHHGIPVTTPTRTVLDLAQVLTERNLRRVVHEGEVQRLVSNDELRERVHRSPKRRGGPRLRAIVDEGPVRTRSEFEEVTYDLLARNRFPRPKTNTPLPGLPSWLEVDFHFPGTSLVVEADGDQFHGTRWRRRMDARKQALIEAAGFRVIRLTWEQVTGDEAQTVRRVRQALET